MTSNQPTFLVFLGPPGSGKGTQARILENYLGLPQISTGDLFRHHIKNKTELGKLAKGYIDRGQLVPDDVTICIVRNRLAREDTRQGAILDGFPRNLVQAIALDEILANVGGVSLVPLFDVSDDEVMRRITGRRVCPSCGAVYHLDFNPPQVPGICDIDGSELNHRDDDMPETVKNRLYVYYKQTSPLIGYYCAKHVLVEVDGSQTSDAVTADLLRVLAEYSIAP